MGGLVHIGIKDLSTELPLAISGRLPSGLWHRSRPCARRDRRESCYRREVCGGCLGLGEWLIIPGITTNASCKRCAACCLIAFATLTSASVFKRERTSTVDVPDSAMFWFYTDDSCLAAVFIDRSVVSSVVFDNMRTYLICRAHYRPLGADIIVVPPAHPPWVTFPWNL